MSYALGRVVRATLGRIVPLLFRTLLIGAGNIPPGGALLVGNHVSYMDPVLLWCVSPRPVSFMAKRELWDSRLIAWALPRLWGFPVSRGEADRQAIATATGRLGAGMLVGMFPEGTRADDPAGGLREAQGGAAFVALRAGVPVVPVAFAGTENVWPRGRKLPRLARVTIRVGEPLDPSTVLPEGGRKERVEALTSVIMDAIGRELAAARKDAR